MTERNTTDQLPKLCLKKKEVASLLKISTRTVDRMVADRKLPKIVFGKRTVRFAVEDVMRLAGARD